MQPLISHYQIALTQARAVVSNPAAYADLTPTERHQLFGFAWAIMKSQSGRPVVQHQINQNDHGPRGAA